MKESFLRDFRRAVLFYGFYFLKTFAVMAGILFALGVATWVTCHETYQYNILTMYAQLYPMFTWLLPFSFTLSATSYLSIALSFGGLRKASFWAVECLLLAVIIGMFACAKAMNLLFLHLPLDEPHMALTLPLFILGLAAVYCSTQIGLLIATITNTFARTIVSVAVILLPCLAYGLFYGLSYSASGNALSLTVFVLGAAYYWILAALCALTLVLGAVYYHITKKAVVR